jgi:hypothetical protein
VALSPKQKERLKGTFYFIIDYDEEGDEVAREHVEFGDRHLPSDIAHMLSTGVVEVEHHFKSGRSRGFKQATDDCGCGKGDECQYDDFDRSMASDDLLHPNGEECILDV